MRNRWLNTQKTWLVPFALLSIVGCSKAGTGQPAGALPQLTVSPVQQPAADPQASARMPLPEGLTPEERADAESLQKMCAEIAEGGSTMPHRSTAEYLKLVETLRSMSPLIAADPKLLKDAYAQALRDSNAILSQYLKDRGKQMELRAFKRGLKAVIHSEQLHDGSDEDLGAILYKVLYAQEGSICADNYLDAFYTQYVRRIDMLGRIVFGSDSNPAPADTLALDPAPSDGSKEVESAPPVYDHFGSSGRALWITIYRWDSAGVLDQIIQALENRFQDRSGRGVVLDFRYAGGANAAVLGRMRQSSLRGWGSLPMLLLTSAETRGMAAVLATELAQRPNVQSWGTASEIYGYGRKLKKQAARLAPTASEVSITIGAEVLTAPGSPAGSARLHINESFLLKQVVVDDLVGEAERLAAQNGASDLPELPPEVRSEPATEGLPPSTAVDPGALENTDGGAASMAPPPPESEPQPLPPPPDAPAPSSEPPREF